MKLNVEQTDCIENLLSKFGTLFSTGTRGFKQTHLAEYIIETVGSPVEKKPYPLPMVKMDWVRDEVEQLLKAGIIRHSVSPWCSPVIVIDKKQIPGQQKEFRLVVDYRALNSVTKLQHYQLPLISQILTSLKISTCISVLDLTMAYHHIPIRECDKAKTAFQAPGLPKFEYNYVSFGLVNAPYAFQQLITVILFNLKLNREGKERQVNAFVYLDDIIVFSDSYEEHMEDLDLVMSRLQGANLTLKKEKCYLFRTNVNFLGYTLCCKGVRPQTEKVEAIRKMGPPTTKSQLHTFLGGMNTFRIFLPDLANITIPLNGLLNKEKTMHDWDDRCDEAFVRAKESLIKIVMLVYPNPALEYKIYVDASGDALGGMLAQTYEVQGKDVDLPIGFTSYTFSKVERCYATITKEAFVIFHCFKKWYTIIDYCPV